MPPTESLAPLLDELFTASAAQGAAVHRQLGSGLHVKVDGRGKRRRLIVWRAGRALPGATECEIVGQDAGLITPKFRTWQCRESDQAFLITEGWQGDLCTHTWGPADPYAEGKASGERSVCTRCGAEWTRLTSPRGKVRFAYNGQPFKRETVWNRWRVTGPVPVAEFEEIPPEVLEELTGRPAPAAPMRGHRQKAEKPRVDYAALARQQERDALERARLSGLLLCVSFWCAAREPWFRRHVVIGARRAYLAGADLADLRAEVTGTYHRRSSRHALPYVLLLCRWPHIVRALPEHATPAPKPARARKGTRKAKA